MISLARVTDFASFHEEVKHHFQQHYETCEEVRVGKQILDIDVELIQALINKNVMFCFAMIKDETFVGYINVTVGPSTIFSSSQATIDFIYILPEHRQKDYATQAVVCVEEELKEQGIYDLNMMLPEKDYSEKFAESLGYGISSRVYCKYLGE